MSVDASRLGRALRGVAVLALAASLSACATTGGGNPRDPFEKFNRAMFTFNDTVDKVALKPAATAYHNILPTFVQTGVANFFGNLADIWTSANDFMQGKGKVGMSDLTRVVVNSTFGIVGLIDIASEAGLQKHNEDFGQTLGTWGVPPGPYLMLPLLGPSTVRDASALVLDIKADPWAYKEPVRWRNVGIAVRVTDQRAAVLDASNLLEEAALDRYEFIRDSFLQRRASRIDDGDGPDKKSDPDDKPAAKADDKSADKPAARPADKASDKPAAKPSDKPAGKSSDKPADKPADKKPDGAATPAPVAAAQSAHALADSATVAPVN